MGTTFSRFALRRPLASYFAERPRRSRPRPSSHGIYAERWE